MKYGRDVHRRSNAMAMLRQYHELPKPCHGPAMPVSWPCHGRVTAVPLQGHGSAMALQWHYQFRGSATTGHGRPRQGHASPMQRLSLCRGIAMSGLWQHHGSAAAAMASAKALLPCRLGDEH